MKKYIERSISYSEYVGLIDKLLADGRTTGVNQSETMFGYGKLNRQRMSRLEKTVELSATVRDAARDLNRQMIWLVITEGWCGDAAQNVPVIEKIAAESDKIETRYVLRDENPDLIDGFVTDGARAIPKLIALDAETFEVLGTWGSRPAVAQDLFNKMKADGTEKAVILEEMQRWYNADKSESLQREFETLLGEWNTEKAAVAVN